MNHIDVVKAYLCRMNPDKEDGEGMFDTIRRAIYDAHIAGSESTKGIGLNLSKEERADQYCKDIGLCDD